MVSFTHLSSDKFEELCYDLLKELGFRSLERYR